MVMRPTGNATDQYIVMQLTKPDFNKRMQKDSKAGDLSQDQMEGSRDIDSCTDVTN